MAIQWSEEARGVYFRHYRWIGPSNLGRSVINYRLRVFEQRGAWMWEIWTGNRRVTAGRSSSIRIAKARAEAAAEGSPSTVQYRQPEAVGEHQLSDATFALIDIVKATAAAVVVLNAALRTYQFNAGTGQMTEMLLSLFVLGIVLTLAIMANARVNR